MPTLIPIATRYELHRNFSAFISVGTARCSFGNVMVALYELVLYDGLTCMNARFWV